METENPFQNLPERNAQRAAQRLMRALTEAGHSRTLPRRAIVEVLAGAQGSLSPNEILAFGQRRHPRLGLVTVYRTLELLTGLGLVRKIHVDGGCHSYVLMQGDHGHHIVCQHCHQVIQFQECEMEHLYRAVARRTGYRVTAHWLELLGVCPQCQRALDHARNEVEDEDVAAG